MRRSSIGGTVEHRATGAQTGHWVSGRMGVSEWLLTGTTGDGRKLAVRGCDHYEFHDGKVVRKDSYWKIVE